MENSFIKMKVILSPLFDMSVFSPLQTSHYLREPDAEQFIKQKRILQ